MKLTIEQKMMNALKRKGIDFTFEESPDYDCYDHKIYIDGTDLVVDAGPVGLSLFLEPQEAEGKFAMLQPETQKDIIDYILNHKKEVA